MMIFNSYVKLPEGIPFVHVCPYSRALNKLKLQKDLLGRSIRISGLKDVSHHIKKLDGFPIKLQMVTAVWENVSLNDLFLLSEASETCLKLSFDPVIDTMTTRLQFGNGKARFLRTMTRPTLMGLISAREVDSVLREPEIMPDGLVVGGGLGLQSPLFVDKIQQSDYLKAVASQPPSKGKVRAVDHTSTMTWCILSILEHFWASCTRSSWKTTVYVALAMAWKGLVLWCFFPVSLDFSFICHGRQLLGASLSFTLRSKGEASDPLAVNIRYIAFHFTTAPPNRPLGYLSCDCSLRNRSVFVVFRII